jgi:hypothetical protein
MTQAGHLSEAQTQQAIDQAAQIQSMERVNFVGGEPFLHSGILASACRRAREHGLRASATTSAYWATTEARAIEVLAPLAEAGLDRIIISYDDPHAAFLREKNITNAYRAARTLGVFAKIAVVVEPGCRIDKNYMASLLGIPIEGDETGEIYETTTNSTGRAREDVSEEQFEKRRLAGNVYRGPCFSILRQISVLPTGQITAGCGVIPFRPQLQIGNLNDDSIGSAVAGAYQNWLHKWIAFEGPVAILEEITAGTEDEVTAETFDGICQACDILFTNSRYLERLQAALPGKIPSLMSQEKVYTALGLFEAPV